MNDSEEKIRQFVELAISSGRSRQSSQTGYIQYCYFQLDEEHHDTIPFYDNFLFALALLSAKKADSIQEAKTLLEKLLHFQCRIQGFSQGNFPEYLHDFPLCRNNYTGLLLLAPFFWILKNFSLVLGSELKAKLTRSAQSLLEYGQELHKRKALPFQMAIRLAAAQKALGELWNQKELKQQGIQFLDELKKESEASDFGTWFSPAYIADTLVALQMAYSSIAKSPWKDFWNYLAESWHTPSRCYIGPSVKLFQAQHEPQVTLYDLFLGYFTNTFSYRSYVNHPIQLQGVLIQPITDPFPVIQFPFEKQGEVANHRWAIQQKEFFGFNVIQKSKLPTPELEKGYHSLFFSWGEKNRTHSLVCQGGNSSWMDYQMDSEKISIYFYLSDSAEVEDKDKSREISLFLDKSEDIQISVAEKQATTFQLDDSLIIQSPTVRFKLSFHIQEGEGRFMGHIQPGNRLAQLSAKGKNRFEAFDTQIFLRTVRRYAPCIIRAELNLSERKN